MRMTCLGYLGWFYTRLGQFDKAIEAYQVAHSYPIGESDRAKQIKSFVLALWTNTMIWQGSFTKGNQLINESLRLQEETNGQGYAGTLFFAGVLALLAGDFVEAKRLAKQSTQNDIHSHYAPFNKRTLARVETTQGNYEEAKRFLIPSLELFRDKEDVFQTTLTVVELGDIVRLQGRFEEAQIYYEEGLAIADNVKVPIGTAVAHWGLGNLAATIGNYEASKYHYRQFRDSAKMPPPTPGGAGWAALGMGELAEARAIFLAELASYTKQQQAVLALHSVAGLARLFALSGALDRALELAAMVIGHSAAWHETKAGLIELREELVAELPAAFVERAEARGRELDLWDSAETLLAPNPIS